MLPIHQLDMVRLKSFNLHLVLGSVVSLPFEGRDQGWGSYDKCNDSQVAKTAVLLLFRLVIPLAAPRHRLQKLQQ
jgi:hypothetical protein